MVRVYFDGQTRHFYNLQLYIFLPDILSPIGLLARAAVVYKDVSF